MYLFVAAFVPGHPPVGIICQNVSVGPLNQKFCQIMLSSICNDSNVCLICTCIFCRSYSRRFALKCRHSVVLWSLLSYKTQHCSFMAVASALILVSHPQTGTVHHLWFASQKIAQTLCLRHALSLPGSSPSPKSSSSTFETYMASPT